MFKKLWIQDFENFQEFFYIIKENVVYSKNHCCAVCEYYNYIADIKSCTLFLKRIEYSERCQDCKKIFGE